MLINATTPTLPIAPVDRATAGHPTQTQSQSKATDAAAKAKVAAEEAALKPKEFTPAPPLRPNLQDYVDINRTLIMLRQVKG